MGERIQGDELLLLTFEYQTRSDDNKSVELTKRSTEATSMDFTCLTEACLTSKYFSRKVKKMKNKYLIFKKIRYFT